MEINNRKKIVLFYEISFLLLALITIAISFLDIINKINISESRIWYPIDLSILGIFIADYFIRFVFSSDKKIFLKNNIFDLIAIIPFSSLFRIFRVFRIVRIVKLFRFYKILRFLKLFVYFKRFTNKFNSFLGTNGFVYTIYITTVTIFVGAFGIYTLEKGKTVTTFSDAIWWSFVTTTTVGYGDISPTTNLGRFIAGFLMLIGIGFVGMLTGTIATYFMQQHKQSNNLTSNETIDTSDLNEEEINELKMFIKFLKSKR